MTATEMGRWYVGLRKEWDTGTKYEELGAGVKITAASVTRGAAAASAATAEQVAQVVIVE